MPKQTLYSNYHIGDCNDLIFGVNLVDYANSRGLHDGDVPKIVRICIAEVDKRGLTSEGIYRVSGRLAAVQAVGRVEFIAIVNDSDFLNKIIHKIEKDEVDFQFDPRTDDVFVVASLLKVSVVISVHLTLVTG